MNSKRKSSDHVRHYVKKLHAERHDVKRLRVFDFDDTLVVTDAKVWVTRESGEKFSLTPAQFAVYEKQPGDNLDYTEFRQLINPQNVSWMLRIFESVYQKYGGEGILILSARSTSEPIHQFLVMNGFSGVRVLALDSADPLAKARSIDHNIRADGLEYVEFFDDSHKNVEAIKALREIHPGVHIVVRHVQHTHLPTHGLTHHYGTNRAPKRSSRHR